MLNLWLTRPQAVLPSEVIHAIVSDTICQWYYTHLWSQWFVNAWIYTCITLYKYIEMRAIFSLLSCIYTNIYIEYAYAVYTINDICTFFLLHKSAIKAGIAKGPNNSRKGQGLLMASAINNQQFFSWELAEKFWNMKQWERICIRFRNHASPIILRLVIQDSRVCQAQIRHHCCLFE